MTEPSGADYVSIEPPTPDMLEAMSLDELRMCLCACLEHVPIDWRGALAYSTEIDRRGYRVFPATNHIPPPDQTEGGE